MCGICGKLNFDPGEPVEPELVQAMMDRIAHRGPDGAGAFVSGAVGLGHRRLSIIDLSTGDQPMCNEDGSVWVVYNGEIYNFRELRADLQRRGHRFKSTSDTEVIVHLYEELGDACVARFEGMFAFALWDAKRRRLLLARDRVGIKPLYIANTGRALLFASEIKSLLAEPGVGRRVDPQAVDRFLTYYYLPGEATLFDGIEKLPPGHYLTVSSGRVAVRRYWDLPLEAADPALPFAAAVDRLRNLLKEAVERHLISDVPVGVLLSGGVDSAGVLAHAAAHTAEPLHTFTMGFEGRGFADERPYARLAAAAFGTRHHEVTMTAAEFRDFLPRYVWHMEEPVCEPPAVALFFVSRLARDSGVKVLLSGEGGDEAFAGYQDYRNLLYLERLKAAFGPFKSVLRAGFAALASAGWRRGRHYADLVPASVDDYYYSRTSTPTAPFNRGKESLYLPGFKAMLGTRRSDAPTRCLLETTAQHSLLGRMLYVDTKTWLPDDLLVKADKMTMATSVELRVPLLDASILQFAASLPDRYKVDGRNLKRILKAALAPIVPPQILARRKAGFPVPYAQWLRGELKDFVRDALLGPDAHLGAYFSRPAVARLVQEHIDGEDRAKEVFSLLVLELWHRRFMTAEVRATAPDGARADHSRLGARPTLAAGAPG
jgi:asparagine synthase (glutamine-hydrolysing)